jgi:hypothetical protein
MEGTISSAVFPSAAVDLELTADFIAGLQRPSGEIPWSEGGKTDPWDHVESAMGLAAAGRIGEAAKAFGWLEETQLSDGSWWSATRDGVVEDDTRDTNISTYMAVGVYHFFLVTGDSQFLRRFWRTMEKGIDYAVLMQAQSGEIAWARNREGVADPMALLTGSSSVYMSLKCAITIAALLGKRRPHWETALVRLGDAIANRPYLFNMMKARFSMDWYYPVLCGAVQKEGAHYRIDRFWEKFVVPDWGVRCVSDRPWVTIAEAAELVLSLAAMGETGRAQIIFNWIIDKRYSDGAYWMGATFPDGVIWPEEKTAWTAAAVILACDALYGLTPAGRIFSHEFWKENAVIDRVLAGGGHAGMAGLHATCVKE